MSYKSLKIMGFVFVAALVTVFMFSVNSYAGDAAAGKAVFDANCAACHGAGGEAMIPGVPNFAKGERLDKDDAALTNSIKTGIMAPKNPAAPPMPPLGLSDGDIANVIAYIRTLKK